MDNENSDEPVYVANWTPEDFSKVYVKYRPALERHARKWLSDPTEVDEVVQDAFLYLFLSLPELDSEIGVLRFLKWKTRLLCLDVLRAHNRRPVLLHDASDNEDEPSTEDGPADVLERMHDAAIVHAALARIPERQREALLRAEFQNQSAAEIGEKLGLSENASRQLVHRARKSFKDSLMEHMGGTDVDVSEILSVAVRKAKQNASKGIALVTLFAITLSGATGQGWLPWNSEQQIEIVKPAPAEPSESEKPDNGSEPGGVTPSPSDPETNQDGDSPEPPTVNPSINPKPAKPEMPEPTPSVEAIESSESTASSFSFDGISQAAVESKITDYTVDGSNGSTFSVVSENGLSGAFNLIRTETQILLDVTLIDQANGSALNLEELKVSRKVLEDGSVRFIYIYQVLTPNSAFSDTFIGVVVHFNLDMTLKATPLISELFS